MNTRIASLAPAFTNTAILIGMKNTQEKIARKAQALLDQLLGPNRIVPERTEVLTEKQQAQTRDKLWPNYNEQSKAKKEPSTELFRELCRPKPQPQPYSITRAIHSLFLALYHRFVSWLRRA